MLSFYILLVLLPIVQSTYQLNTTDTNETSFLDESVEPGGGEFNLSSETYSAQLENSSEATVVATLMETAPTIATVDYEATTRTDLITNSTNSVEAPSTTLQTSTEASTQLPEKPSRTNVKDDKPKLCSCDFSKGECDINCCCDKDCTDVDKKIFDRCYEESDFRQHTGLCYSRMFLYKNNTSYRVVKEEKGLFCIAQDNFPERLHYTDQKIVSSFSTFNKIWNRKKHFVWNQLINKDLHQFNNEFYRYGSPLWRYNTSASYLSNIDLPIPFSSGLCDSHRTVKYLESFETTCLIEPTAESCLMNRAFNAATFANLSLIVNPSAVNVTHSEAIISEEHVLVVRTILCEAEYTSLCTETQSIPAPFFDQTLQTCRNVLKSFDFQLKHNGSAGIVEAQLIIKLYNTSTVPPLLEDDRLQLRQHYKVTFDWAKNDSDSTFRRSGTPGYLDGKPLIYGSLISRKVGDKTEKYIMINGAEEDDHSGHWLVIPKAVGQDGHCDGKMEVLFNSNVLSQCTINLHLGSSKNYSCEELHKMIWTKLFNGYRINVTNPNQLDVLVSSHGNPEPLRTDQWVPIFLEHPADYDYKSSRCPVLISSIRYHILYSYHGSIVRPQAKIIGILAKLETSKLLCANRDDSSENSCLFKLSASVTFTDVSQKAISKFAKPPVIRIRLPSDFFYPFTSSSFLYRVDLYLVLINMCSLMVL